MTLTDALSAYLSRHCGGTLAVNALSRIPGGASRGAMKIASNMGDGDRLRLATPL